MGMLSPNPHLRRVLVPIDFSEATLLVLKFLQKFLMRDNGFYFKFIHVVPDQTGVKENPKRQWKKIKQIARVDQAFPLHAVRCGSTVASTISDVIKDRHFGTVVMGKRGFSGIKRWLVGSVSTGVIHQLTDQTLFLID